jgi:hypothetical protein
MNSTTYSDLWQRAVDEALASTAPPDPIPAPEPPSSPAEGARILQDILSFIEAFGLPEPDLAEITYSEILL